MHKVAKEFPGLNLLVRKCQKSGSYTLKTDVSAETHMQSAYEVVEECHPDPECGTISYRDGSGAKLEVIVIKFRLLVPRKTEAHQISGQIIFPPDFPIGSPIFSIRNENELKFQINSYYLPYLLPDGTYEVRLSNEVSWEKIGNINDMLIDFFRVLSITFPFTSIPYPIRNTNFPTNFAPVYFENQEISAHSNLRVGGSSPGERSSTFDKKKLKFRKTESSLGKKAIRNSFLNKNIVFQKREKRDFRIIKSELEADCKLLYENINFLIDATEQIEFNQIEIQNRSKLLTIRLNEMKAQENCIRKSVEDFEKSPKTKLEDFINYASLKEEGIVIAASTLAGTQEAEYFLEHLFFESPKISIQVYLMRVNLLWRKQFDCLLALKIA